MKADTNYYIYPSGKLVKLQEVSVFDDSITKLDVKSKMVSIGKGDRNADNPTSYHLLLQANHKKHHQRKESDYVYISGESKDDENFQVQIQALLLHPLSYLELNADSDQMINELSICHLDKYASSCLL